MKARPVGSVSSSIFSSSVPASPSALLFRPTVVELSAVSFFRVAGPVSFGSETFLPGPVKVYVG